MKTWLAALLCLLVLPWMAEAGEFYRWVDENGVSHVTDQPPPESEKKVTTYRFKKQYEPVSPEQKTEEEKQSSGIDSQAQTIPEGNHQGEENQGLTCEQEREQVRAAYDTEKSNESRYTRNYNNSYGYGKERRLWRERLDNIETLKHRLESLEHSCGTSGQTSSTSTQESVSTEE